MGLLGSRWNRKKYNNEYDNRFIEPTEGTIVIDGFDVEKKPRKAKKKLGICQRECQYTQI